VHSSQTVSRAPQRVYVAAGKTNEITARTISLFAAGPLQGDRINHKGQGQYVWSDVAAGKTNKTTMSRAFGIYY
jgi:hypothetical protein